MHPGDLAPDFTLPDHRGVDFSLSENLARARVVLFFYPSALSRGCTKESCHFRDLAEEFKALGAQRVGISMDNVQRQARFAQSHDFDYPLLSDERGHVAELYGVKRGADLLRVKRVTFVIDTDRTLIDVITSELAMHVHADKALQALTTRG